MKVNTQSVPSHHTHIPSALFSHPPPFTDLFNMVGAYGKPVALLLASWLLFRFLRFARREKHLPPGPPTLPMLGNVHLIPATNIHLKYDNNKSPSAV
jgi:hypothetical protein